MDDLIAAFNKSYDLRLLAGRGNEKAFIPMCSNATLPDVVAEEIRKGMRKALMNESYGINPDPWYENTIHWHIYDPATVKIGEPIDMKDLIRNFEIKKKSTKKGDAIVYSCYFGYGDRKFTIECYEQFFWLAPEAVIALFPIMYKTSTGKLIFRDRKVIAISEYKKTQFLKEPDKNGNRTKVGYVSYVANCMDGDVYNPYVGAFIAISKRVNDGMAGAPVSKSEIKRLYKQIGDFYESLK